MAGNNFWGDNWHGLKIKVIFGIKLPRLCVWVWVGFCYLFYIWWIQHITIPIRRVFILIIFTARVSTDLCRVVIAAFLVLQILRVFNVVRRVQFTRDSPAVVWHTSLLKETFYLAQLAVWRGDFPDEVPFQSFSREMMNEIQDPAVIVQEKGRAGKIKRKRTDGTR